MNVHDTFVLDQRTLLHHRGGQVLALETRAIGRSFPLVSGPRPSTRRRVIGSRVTSFLGLRSDKKASRSEVAVVEVLGPLSQRSDTFCGWVDGYDAIAVRVAEELERPEVAAVVLRIDSPGGDVAGLEEGIRAIVAARDKAEKPVAVYVDELAASAAYWLAASVADAGIYAPASAEIGSIGAYTMLVDERGSLERDGVIVKLVRDPAGKDAGNPLDPVFDLALERETERVRDASGRFYAAVSAARGLGVDAVRALNAATFGTQGALEACLVDGVCSFDDVVRKVFAKTQEVKAQERRRVAGAKEKAMARRRGKKAEEMLPAAPEEESSGRATAAEVSATCAECATACTECAAACDSGTADEAIAAVGNMVAACQAAIAAGESFLGGSVPAPAPEEPMAEDGEGQDEEEPKALVRRLDKLEADVARRADEDERARTLAAKRSTAEQRARMAAMSMPEFRAAAAVLPDRYDGGLAADVGIAPTRGASSHGLTERELNICKKTGCSPEKFAAAKARAAERS